MAIEDTIMHVIRQIRDMGGNNDLVAGYEGNGMIRINYYGADSLSQVFVRICLSDGPHDNEPLRVAKAMYDKLAAFRR